MKTVSKQEIVKVIADKNGLTAAETTKVIQSLMDHIIAELGRGNRIEFREFGIFELKKHGARVARNFSSGVAVLVPPKTVVSFKPGKAMREAVRTKGAQE